MSTVPNNNRPYLHLLSAWHSATYSLGITVILILQVKNLRLRQRESPAPGHMSHRVANRDSRLAELVLLSTLLPAFLTQRHSERHICPNLSILIPATPFHTF